MRTAALMAAGRDAATAHRPSPVRDNGRSLAPPHYGLELVDRRGSAGRLQLKSRIGAANDPLEHEADRMADAVMNGGVIGPVSPAGTGAAQRACAGCAAEDEIVQRKCAACEEEAGPLQREAAGAGAGGQTAPPIVDSVLGSPGQPLEPTARDFMATRFGADFSGVRVHADAQAAQSAAAVNARAYTVGRDIVFGAGEYDPASIGGRRLLAHELAHVRQQSTETPTLRRWAECKPVRMSLEDCPSREPGEEAKSAREPAIVEYITSPEPGYLIAGFAVGKSDLKSTARTHVNWSELIKTVTEPKSAWEVWGLSDCHGPDGLNGDLRDKRAKAVARTLTAAGAKITHVAGAALSDCITGNDNPVARTWNRAVLIRASKREVAFEPDTIEGTRPVPKPATQPTTDCGPSQKSEIAAAQPIAVDMVRTALYALRSRDDPFVKDRLKAYFNDDSAKTFERVHDGLGRVLKGLKSNVTFECEKKGSLGYDRFCPSGSSVTLAYVRHWLVALNVHLCEAAFGRPDLDMAATFVHEFSHVFDRTDDKMYCWTGGCSSLTPEAAYNNADSYARFAADVYVRP